MTPGETVGLVAAVLGAVGTPTGILWTALRKERDARILASAECDQRLANAVTRLEGRISVLEKSRDDLVEKRVMDQREATADLSEVSKMTAASIDGVAEELRALRAEVAMLRGKRDA